MGDLASKIKAKFKRRTSGTPSIASSTKSKPGRTRSPTSQTQRSSSFIESPTSRSEKHDHGHASEDPASLIPAKEPEPTRLSAPPSPAEPPYPNVAIAATADATTPTAAQLADESPKPSGAQEPTNSTPTSPIPSPSLSLPLSHGASTKTPPVATIPAPAAAAHPTRFGSDHTTGASDRMGKDLQRGLPCINEHPHDSSTSTDSPNTTTDEDDFQSPIVPIQTPSTLDPGSGEPTPRASQSQSHGPSLSPISVRNAQTPQARPSQDPVKVSPVVSNSPIAARRQPIISNPTLPTPARNQSPAPGISAQLLRSLLNATNPDDLESLPADHPNLGSASAMGRRKIWVRRPGASATLVTINEDDVVDDVRDMILRKYANSLGRQFDSPDLTLRIVPREQQRERQLGPDEHMCKTIDAYFPGGQTVDDALIIDVPLRRTPRPSPRSGPPHAPHMASVYYAAPASADDTHRPPETGTDYFGPAVLAATAHLANGGAPPPHSIGVLTTGQIPQIPSPGGTRTARAYRDRPERPRLGRQHTSSPTILNLVSNSHAAQMPAGTVLDHTAPPPPAAPPLPTPPVPESISKPLTTPPAHAPQRVASPRPPIPRAKKSKKTIDTLSLPQGILSGGVPPINVLIVEDNPINLRLLEVFVKRLKVRWQTAVNGREAVDKWREGGFHLVLMDIQLPVMSGLEATREIRRLERVNSIGVFSSSASSAPEELVGEPSEEDRLVNTDMFKSPVIIVALTASSLQSDRHEALAAGCNDFLTKPVNFVWFEKKIMEWGCMQALIDFDGWRKWKDFSQKGDEKAVAAAKAKKKNRTSLTTASSTSGITAIA